METEIECTKIGIFYLKYSYAMCIKSSELCQKGINDLLTKMFALNAFDLCRNKSDQQLYNIIA